MINRAPIVALQVVQSTIIRPPLAIAPETSQTEARVKITGSDKATFSQILPKSLLPTREHQQNNLAQELRSTCLIVVEGRAVANLVSAKLSIRTAGSTIKYCLAAV